MLSTKLQFERGPTSLAPTTMTSLGPPRDSFAPTRTLVPHRAHYCIRVRCYSTILSSPRILEGCDSLVQHHRLGTLVDRPSPAPSLHPDTLTKVHPRSSPPSSTPPAASPAPRTWSPKLAVMDVQVGQWRSPSRAFYWRRPAVEGSRIFNDTLSTAVCPGRGY